jgi:hypothetical protein
LGRGAESFYDEIDVAQAVEELRREIGRHE